MEDESHREQGLGQEAVLGKDWGPGESFRPLLTQILTLECPFHSAAPA